MSPSGPGLTSHPTICRSVCISPSCACPLRVSKCILLTCICCSTHMFLSGACLLRVYVAPCLRVHISSVFPSVFFLHEYIAPWICLLRVQTSLCVCLLCVYVPFVCHVYVSIMYISLRVYIPPCVCRSMCVLLLICVAPSVCCCVIRMYVLSMCMFFMCMSSLCVCPAECMSNWVYFCRVYVQSVVWISSPFVCMSLKFTVCTHKLYVA